MIIEKCKASGYKVKSPGNVIKMENIIPPKYDIICKTPIVTLFLYKQTEIAAHVYGEFHFRKENDETKIKQLAREITKDLIVYSKSRKS